MTTQRKGKRKLWLWIGAPVLLAAIIFGVVTVASGNNNKIEPSQLAKAEKGDIARSVVATGKVQPITKVEVKSKASGIVTNLNVDINAVVHRGQQIAQLDQVEILAQVDAQKASLTAAESNAKRRRLRHRPTTKSTPKPPTSPCTSTPTSARSACRRMASSPGRLSTTLSRSTSLPPTPATRPPPRSPSTALNCRRHRPRSRKPKPQLKQLEEQLSYTVIQSPMDGVILSRDVEKGDAVSSILVLGSTATLVMTIGDVHQVYVQGKVDESDIGKVYLGQPARIKVESFKDKTFFGKVTRIAPLGVEKDNVTTFEVRVSIDNPGGELKANMTANAEVILDEHKGVVTVPEQAVIYDKDRNASVEVPDPKQKTGRRKVGIKAGISNGTKTEILAGLNPGDTVILQQ